MNWSRLQPPEGQHTCREEVWRGYARSSCGKKAKHEFNGRWYCKFHHPPNVEAKEKAKEAQISAYRAVEDLRYAVTKAEADVVRIAERCSEEGDWRPLVQSLDALVLARKAAGELREIK